MENSQQPFSNITSSSPIGTGDRGKTAAIVAYIFVIGWLISYFALYNDNKTPLARFHIRQSLFIHIIHVAIWLIQISIWLGAAVYFLLSLLSLAVLILLIIGLVNAANEQTKPLPIVGEPAQRMFPNI